VKNKRSQKSVHPYGALIVLAGVILFIVLAIIPNYPQNRVGQNQPQVIATLDPTIIANLTRIPKAPPLTGIEAQALNDLKVQIDACDGYSDERRAQMEQHIRWLLNPSTIPSDILIAVGPNPIGRLTFGMAGYTSTEWRLQNRPANSCLVAIGRTLNEMLVAAGEPPLTIYDE
jgi:hypothetical protein